MDTTLAAPVRTAPGRDDARYPKFLIERIEIAPREQIERQQEAELEIIVAHAYERAPLFRKLWDDAGLRPRDIKSLADFKAKAPFFDKDMIRAFRDASGDPCGGINGAAPGDLKAIGTTSGTTGDPMPVPTGLRTISEQGYARDLWHMGARPGDYIANVMHTFRGGHRARTNIEIGLTPILFTLGPHEMPRLCEASMRFRPTTLSMLSNPLLLALEQLFETTDIDPKDVFRSYKGAIFGGEPLGGRLKALVDSWGLEIFETTSLGDLSGATECWAHNGMHAWEDLALVECLDVGTGEPVPDGQPGELVVTALVDRYMPLIRYRTEDIVTLDRSQCSCGRTHVRFKPLGRKGDQIIVEGNSILPRDVWAVVESHSETRAGLFQIIRTAREMDELVVRVGYDPVRLKDTPENLISRLREQLVAHTGVTVRIELIVNDELLKLGPPHKIPRVTKK